MQSVPSISLEVYLYLGLCIALYFLFQPWPLFGLSCSDMWLVLKNALTASLDICCAEMAWNYVFCVSCVCICCFYVIFIWYQERDLLC